MAIAPHSGMRELSWKLQRTWWAPAWMVIACGTPTDRPPPAETEGPPFPPGTVVVGEGGASPADPSHENADSNDTTSSSDTTSSTATTTTTNGAGGFDAGTNSTGDVDGGATLTAVSTGLTNSSTSTTTASGGFGGS